MKAEAIVYSRNYRTVDVPVWAWSAAEGAYCYATRLLDTSYNSDELKFVMDAELTPKMRAQEYEKSGVRCLPAKAVAKLVRSPADTY